MKARKLFAAAIILLSAACTDGGDGTGPEARPDITADAASYQPFEVATLTLSGAASASGIVVPGTLGSTQISLVSSSDSTMVFLVPATPGTHNLKFDIGTRSYSGSITVVAGQNVANPETFLDAIGDVADAGVTAAASAVAGQQLPGDSVIVLEMLQEARDSLASFRRMLAQMTPAEAQQVANILNANLSVEHRALVFGVQAGAMQVSAFEIPAVCREKNTALEQYQCTWGEFYKSLKDVAAYLGGAALAAKTMPTTGLVGAGVAVVATTFALLEGVNTVQIGLELLVIHGMLAWEIGAATVNATAGLFRTDVVDPLADLQTTAAARMTGPTLSASLNASSATAMTRLTNDRAVTFTFSPKLRRVQATDRALPLSWVNGALSLVAQYNSMVKPRYQIKFRPPLNSFPTTVPHSQIDVEIVTNNNVKVKSVTGSGDRTTVVFTTTAAGVQKFTYDIVYTSGVYPEVRIRHEAELHPPTFIFADVNGRELPDTMRLMSRWQYNVLLLNPDGTRIDPNLTVSLGTETSYTGGAHIGLTYTYNSAAYMDAIVQPNRQRVVDTLNATVMKDGTPLRQMTFILTDSLTMYTRTVPGNYTHTFLSSNGTETRDQLVFNANGTGTVLARTNVRTGQTITGYNPNFTWGVWQENEGGKPVFDLEWTWGSYGYSQKLSYGQTSYLTNGAGGRSTLSKLP